MTTNIRTISQLPETTSVKDNTLFEVSEVLSTVTNSDGIEINKYASKKILASNVTKYAKDGVIELLKEDYGLTTDVNFGKIQNFTNDMLSGSNSLKLSGEHKFEKLPEIDEVLTSFSSDDKHAVNVQTLKKFESTGNTLLINNDSTFTTQYMNVEDQLYPDEVKTGIDNAPSVEAEKHNVYIFMINGTESNIWTAPADGMFTCYGWVDEEDGSAVDNAKRWVALEANFGGNVGWKILQLQPVMPNEYCSYVSFTFPVNKGLQLRLESGFTVGTNSNKYNNVQGSMTNHLANAFVGGIYSKYNFNTYGI